MLKEKSGTIILIIAALAGMAALAYATDPYPGVGGDATIYMTSASNFIAGKGLGLIEANGNFRLIPYFPPGFPLLLSIFGLSGLPMLQIARWVNIILFSGMIFLAGAILIQASGSKLLGWLGAFFLAASPFMLGMYAWAMSEPLALFLGFLSLLLLSHFHKSGKSWNLIAAGIAAGFAVLTRYNALAFALAGCWYLFFLQQKPWRVCFKPTVQYGLLSILPISIWSVISYISTQTVSSRRWEMPPDLGAFFGNFWADFSQSVQLWFLPDSWVYLEVLPKMVMVGIVPFLLLMAVFVYIAWRMLSKNVPPTDSTEFWMPVLFHLGWMVLALTLVIRLTTYPPITINGRMLSPFYLSLVLLLLVGIFDLSRRIVRGPWLNRLFLLALLVVVLVYAWTAKNTVSAIHENGLGYTAKEWRTSETIEAVKALSADENIVTNQDMAVLFWTGRVSYPVKEVYRLQPDVVFQRYGDGEISNDEGQRLFKENKAVLVLFDTIGDQLHEIYLDKTQERVQALTEGLEVLFTGNDGGIYRYP